MNTTIPPILIHEECDNQTAHYRPGLGGTVRYCDICGLTEEQARHAIRCEYGDTRRLALTDGTDTHTLTAGQAYALQHEWTTIPDLIDDLHLDPGRMWTTTITEKEEQ